MPNPRAVKEISIHALREEGDHRSLFRSAQKIDFYPRPPRGGRPTSSLPSWRGGNFYPRPPRGGRQAYKTDGWVGLAFLSTPSARRATWPAHRGRRQIPISIHALREEGDDHANRCVHPCTDFYPRPPRGGRPISLRCRPRASRFLSTPSARRATGPVHDHDRPSGISIHALREEGDLDNGVKADTATKFLSTPSARRATGTFTRTATAGSDFYPRPPRGGRPGAVQGRDLRPDISIHALREEGDSDALKGRSRCQHFYPRPPRGGRQVIAFSYAILQEFLSTPSARRATWKFTTADRAVSGISIHALREEGDSPCAIWCSGMDLFLSTPSARRATQHRQHDGHHQEHFYPRPPRGGRRAWCALLLPARMISIHALREEGDPAQAA